MSAQSSQMFCPFRMIIDSLYRRPCRYVRPIRRQQPVAGLTTLVVMATLLPTPGIAAQLPIVPSASAKRPATLISQLLPETPYTLGSGDRIRLDIFAVPEYSGEYQVLVDGTLNLPVVGSLFVQGKTIQAVTNEVRNAYSRYVRRPVVTVSLLVPRPFKIGISGEVNRPGSYTIPVNGGTGGTQYPTLTQAIQLAGGITQSAGIDRVVLRRRGTSQPYNLNLSQLLRGNLGQDISLRDGDIISIPTVTTVNLVQVRQLTNASFGSQSNTPINVVISGEVSRPGTYTVAPDAPGTSQTTTSGLTPTSASRPPTLTKVVILAGGTTPSADIHTITVRRLIAGGSPQDIPIDLWKLLQGDVSQDIPLQDGDSIIIPTLAATNPSEALSISNASFAAAAQQNQQPLKIAVVGEVFRPGTYVVTANQTVAGTTAAGATATGTSVGSGSPPTVTKALQGAGGITPLADVRSIEVRRSPRNGIAQVIPINLWQLLVKGDLTQDVILQDGDTITVPKATKFDPTEASTIASASFSPTSITVNVVGEVIKPGPVQVPPNTPLNQALLAAGGFNNARAKSNKVQLLRLNPNGTVTRRIVDIDFKQGINEKTNPTVQNNDVIVVDRNGITKFSDTLTTITAPITGVFSTIGIFKTLGGN